MEKEPIHLFLDTTLTFDDPFFKKNYNHQLFRLSQIHGFTLLMSKIVYEETRNKYELNVKQRIGNLETALHDLEQYYPTNLNTVTINCTIEDFMQKFDSFYMDLIERGTVTIIDYDNDLLPILVERSIKRIKPFGNKKQEFRDAITWLSYVRYAESNSLQNCFLITKNTNDFCDNNTKNTIHPDLLLDSTKFSHYTSAYDLFESEDKLKPYIISADVTEWLNFNKIDSDFIEEKFQNVMMDVLEERFTQYIEQGFIDHFVKMRYIPDHVYIKVNAVSFSGVADGDEITTTVINDQIIVSGDIFVDIEITLYAIDDIYRDEHNIGSDLIQLITTFTFTMDKSNIHIDSLEFDNTDVYNKADFEFIFEDEYY